MYFIESLPYLPDTNLYLFLRENGVDNFYANKVGIPWPDAGITTTGAKLLKSFKFFFEDSTECRKWQDKASILIGESKLEGKLCFSVHPLDFLSISENNLGWRSCHALDGDYRAGNLSYMVDTSTFICYIKSEKPTHLKDFPPDIPWNNKKWRVLMFVNNNEAYKGHADTIIMFAGRQYPFTSMAALNVAKDELEKLLIEKLPTIDGLPSTQKRFSNWKNKYIQDDIYPEYAVNALSTPYFSYDGYLYPMNELCADAEGSLHFNDLIHSSCYKKPYYTICEVIYPSNTWRTDVVYPMSTAKYNIHFNIGGRVNCLRCGAYPIHMSESFLCDDCTLRYSPLVNDDICVCPYCGERFYSDSGYWINDNDFVCEDCFEEYRLEEGD